MVHALSPAPVGHNGQGSVFRTQGVRVVRGLMEALVLLLICWSPWPYGSVHPLPELLLYAGIGLLLVLWGVRWVLEGRLTWQKCPLALCLAGLFLYGALQLTPLPHSVLGWLSPATVQLYDQFLPTRPEVLPSGQPRDAVPLPAGSALSVYPGGTRAELVRLLAVFLLFAVVRNNLTSAGTLRRLSIAAVVLGSALSLFALAQFFTSPNETLFWTERRTNYAPFGPFICRNHFAFHVNVCIGLGLGLLLSLRPGDAYHSGQSPSRRGGDPEDDSLLASPLALLHHPAALWVCAALALMLSSIAVCLSRGGFLALVAGFVVLTLAAFSRSRRFVQLGTVAVLVAMTAGLVVWFGYDRFESRIATIWKPEALEEGRVDMWTYTLPVARDFLVWGTGLGTFAVVEPLGRQPANVSIVYWDHAHNDYLEALVEGGLVRLLLSLLAIVLVFRLGYRAFARCGNRPAGALLLGALFGFTTVVVHSVGDFGLHVPAIVVLVTVLAAHLAAPPEPEPRKRPAARPERANGAESYAVRLWGLAPVAGLAGLTLLGLVLLTEGWKAHQAERHRLAAAYLAANPDPDAQERRFRYLQSAVDFAPDDAPRHVDLAEAHYQRLNEPRQQHAAQGKVADTVRAALAGLGAVPAPEAAAGLLAAAAAHEEAGRRAEQALAGRHLEPALRHYLQARDLSPLLLRPQIRLAANFSRLKQADPGSAYLGRTKRLLTSDPEVWYLAGLQELQEGQSDLAWRSWRRSLECSDRYLADILERSGNQLAPREVLDKVLPDSPELLLHVARLLFPQDDAAESRRPFLEKGLALLRDRPGLKPKDLYAQASLYAALDRPEEALKVYRQALLREPQQAGWRFEYAKLLHRQRRPQEARNELLFVVDQQPWNTEAQQLLERVSREARPRRE